MKLGLVKNSLKFIYYSVVIQVEQSENESCDSVVFGWITPCRSIRCTCTKSLTYVEVSSIFLVLLKSPLHNAWNFPLKWILFLSFIVSFSTLLLRNEQNYGRIRHFYIRKLRHWVKIKSSTDKLIKNMFSSCATVVKKTVWSIYIYWYVQISEISLTVALKKKDFLNFGE